MPDRIGKYEIRGEIGKGGFGKVYRGFDPTVGRLVAIKVLSSGGDPSLLARFRTEATAAGNLNHKNIVTVFEFGEDHGTFFLVMEYLEGRDLQHVMPEANTIKLVDKMNIMSQVAEGLQCAHQHGIVHRDIKPANIMLLADGTVKIMDFGIARLTHANSARLTQSGFLIGTLSYMAPELLNGGEADALCDIWAFGTIYYELLCGQHPFEASDTAAAMYRIMSWEPHRIKSVFPDCPEALDNVIHRLLTKDRESRYQSLEDVLFDTAPILLELESQQAGRLVSLAQELIGQGKLEDAEPVIKQILALDPLHQDGRALRKELQVALRRRTVQTRVQTLLEQSGKFAAVNNFNDAVRTLETAVGIDGSNASLAARLKELQDAKERYELAQQFLAQARADFDQRNLTSAFQAASDALNAEPGNSEARNLLTEVRQRMAERDSERRLREGLSNVKGLIALQSFDEASAVIENLIQQGSDTTELRELLRSTRQQSEDFQRERRIRTDIDAAKEAIKNRRFEDAVAKLGPLANEPACKGEVAGLLAYASEELALAERAASVKSLGKEAYALLKAKDYDGALARVDAGLKTFQDEEMLLKLRKAVLLERAQEEQRNAIRQALEESASLDRSGQWEQAMAPLEKALWQYPEDASLRAAHDQAKKKNEEQKQAARLAALENELKQAHRLLDQGQPDSATQLLQHLTMSYPGEAAVTTLLDRAKAEEERRAGLESLNAEVRQFLQRGRSEEAIEAIARGKMQYGSDAQLLALELEAERMRGRKQSFEQATQASRARNWTLAEKTLEGMLAQDGTDSEARSLWEEVRRERQEEQREQLRSSGRKEAAKLLQSNRFDDAIRGLRSLCEQFPEDGAIREDLRGAVEAKERQSQRDAYAQGRQQAEALVRTGKFDAAIVAIEKLLVQFPEDAALREDERAAREAKLQQERRSRYNSERQRAAELVRNRKFDEAIRALEAMWQQFPGDPGIEEDLRSAQAAKGLQTERFEINQQVAQLEQFYRQGKPAKVKELAIPLLAKLEEPRARELLDWAEATLTRPPSGIQPGVPAPPTAAKRYMVWAGVGAVLLAILGLLIFALRHKDHGATQVNEVKSEPAPPPQPIPVPSPHPEPGPSPDNSTAGNKEPAKQPPDARVTAKLSLDQDQVPFDWQIGTAVPGPKAVLVHASGSTQKWKATVNKGDNWIVATPSDSSLAVGVDPRGLGRGSYSSVIVVSLEQVQVNLNVRLTVSPAAVVAQPPPPVQPQPQPPPPPLQPMTDCGPGYSRKKQETLIWNGDLKPGSTLVLGLRGTVVDGGGRIEGYGLPGCEVTIEDLTSGLTVDERPTAQNQFQRMRLRNTSGRSMSTVSFYWKVTMK